MNRETPTWLRWEEVSHSEERQAKKGQGWAVTLGIYSIFGTFFLFEENKQNPLSQKGGFVVERMGLLSVDVPFLALVDQL